METPMERIANAARRNTKLRFTSIAHLITADLIRKHLDKIQISSAKGVDGQNVTEAKETFEIWIGPLLQKIFRKGYKAPPVRRVHIPKPGRTETRPIGIPTVIDRALQGAVSEILNQIYEQDFLPNSFGGRPKSSCHHAIINLTEAIHSKKANWIYEYDLKNFFGSMTHEWIMQFVSHRVGDPRILNLIQRWLRAGVINEGVWESTEIGTPQGGPISVLLSNLYMHYALDLWFIQVVRPKLYGQAELVRYLDDFVIVLQKEQDGKSLGPALELRLGKFGLKLNYEKTRCIPFGRFSFEKKGAPGNFQFLGFTIYEAISRTGKFRVGIKASRDRINRALVKLKSTIRTSRHQPIAWQIKRINQSLRGLFNYFCFSDCVVDQFRIRKAVLLVWYSALASRSQRRLQWARYFRILKWNPLQKTGVRIGYKQFGDYLRL